jgi:hypothetical protein
MGSSAVLSPGLDSYLRFPLEAWHLHAVNADFTEFRHLTAERGYLRAMSMRQDICAIERTAKNAGSAATLILGTLLLLIRP